MTFAGERGAIISGCEKYRYALWRAWDDDLPTIAFIMLNPSTADGLKDDNTIRKCVKFAKAWGYGRLIVGNLFAWRATDPAALVEAHPEKVIGPETDPWLIKILTASEDVVCAWGVNNPYPSRAACVRELIRWSGITAHALRITKAGHPGHPLYIRDDALRIPYV